MRAYFGGGKTMKILKIALLQIAPCDTLQENMEKGIRYCMISYQNHAKTKLYILWMLEDQSFLLKLFLS